jgi:hypothetical protein
LSASASWNIVSKLLLHAVCNIALPISLIRESPRVELHNGSEL